ncbi:4726_t:CDS:2, partial [Rhizophagus irregularis]
DYKKIDSQLWETYAEKIEKLLDKEKDIIDNVEILINNINRIWNTIRDTFKKANSELPKKKDIDRLLDKNIKEFKEIVKIAFKLVQANFAEENKIYKEEKMKFYIQQRSEDLQDNKKRFLDFTLNRKR